MKSFTHFMPRLFFLAAIFFAFLGASAFRASATATAVESGQVVPSYTLATTDLLRISVYDEENLSSIVRIDAKGNVNLPLIGEIRIAGLTVRDAQKTIESAYYEGRFLRHAQVTITVQEYAPREVAIEGQVRNPGRYPLPIESTMTVVDLVTKAGGLTDIARGTAVTIARTLPDGKKVTYTVDVESVIRGKKPAKPEDGIWQLQPGDIVYVPERLI